MKTLTTLFVILVLSLTNVMGQESITESTQGYVDAFVNNEFAEVATLTHPDLVDMNGGEAYVVEDLKDERLSSSGEGLVYNSAEVKAPLKILEYNGEIQAIMPVEYTMQLVDKEYINKTYILAVSTDGGKTYKFVNLMQFDDASLREFVGNLSPEISIPQDGGFTEK
ncbi:hypothetical protein N9L92_01755 [Saprospiraceae bacterium]|nr:hypothetical protein [Saprospiraceae bacterium]